MDQKVTASCVCVPQESQWLDSVSLLIKDSMEGDLIDNLSGSVFHHYSSPPVCKDCKGHPPEVSRVTHASPGSLRGAINNSPKKSRAEPIPALVTDAFRTQAEDVSIFFFIFFIVHFKWSFVIY